MNLATFNAIKGINITENTKVFEIKVGRGYEKVRATSMTAINEWCNVNGVSNWRMVGMQSTAEMQENLKLKIVA